MLIRVRVGNAPKCNLQVRAALGTLVAYPRALTDPAKFQRAAADVNVRSEADRELIAVMVSKIAATLAHGGDASSDVRNTHINRLFELDNQKILGS